MTNEDFRHLVLKYFRNGCLNKQDKVIGMLFPGISFALNAKKIVNYFSVVKKVKYKDIAVPVSIEPYKGKNKTALTISDFLKPAIKDDVIGVYIHGSVGTSEEMAYSDFDGLVILRNDVFTDAKRLKRVALLLKESEKFMYEMDPLQHHGWFILSEADLENYPENYFPHEVFRFSKCLFGETNLQIQLRLNGYKKELEKSYFKLAQGILLKIESKSFLGNTYRLKNFLSECMLLPAFYLEAKTGNGIFKKSSFTILKNEIGEVYSILDDISEIRSQWKYDPPEIYLRTLKKKRVLFGLTSASEFSGLISHPLIEKFDENFFNRLRELINFLGNRLYK